jgi:hypothetical protein
VRRNWPDSLISWTRFCGGQFRNPLVASHILAGITSASAFEWLAHQPLRALMSAAPDNSALFSTIPAMLSADAYYITTAVFGAMGFVLLMVLARLAVHRIWIADTLACLVLALGGVDYLGSGYYRNAASIPFFTFASALWLWLFRRFGLLSLLTSLAALFIMRRAPLLFSSWFTGWVLMIQLLILSVAVWAVWVIVSAHERRGTEFAA